ncbi:MAG TPA: CaiB/BaiF CoA-transferase family protein [Paracoccaceae bacterium]|nr:CaiB/BaiF CoA-transferase family protein [Paracoccaceae bacterium]
MKPLEGMLVVTLEQAVAAPLCSARLADAGGRVIKLERPEGDFARLYDSLAGGESAYFVWLNRGKESVCLDLGQAQDRALLEALLSRADIFVQNLKPGALDRLGFARERLRAAHPSLILCSISGYGEEGPYAGRKAYDLLVQAESGLATITGSPDGPGRVGVSVVDIATGLAAYEAILEAVIRRGRTGEGADLRIAMFDTIADWMTVPLLQHEGGKPPARVGLAHPSIAPYGVFRTADGVDLLISVQNDREWRLLAEMLLGEAGLGRDERFATNVARCARRAETDALAAAAFARKSRDEIVAVLEAAGIAFGGVSSLAGLSVHPHLSRIRVGTPSGPVDYPAPPFAQGPFGPVPALGEHTEAVRAEFLGGGGRGGG